MTSRQSPRSYLSTPTGVNEEEGLEISCTPTPGTITPNDESILNYKSRNPYAAIDIKILEYNKCDLNIVNSTPHSPADECINSSPKYPMNVSIGYSSPINSSNYTINTSTENINDLKLQLGNVINAKRNQFTPQSFDTGKDVVFGDNAIANNKYKRKRKKSKHSHSKKSKLTNTKHSNYKKRFNVPNEILNELELDNEQIVNSFAPKKPIYNPFAPNNINKRIKNSDNENPFSEKKHKSKYRRHKYEKDKNYNYNQNKNKYKSKSDKSSYYIVDNDDDNFSCMSYDNDSVLYG